MANLNKLHKNKGSAHNKSSKSGYNIITGIIIVLGLLVLIQAFRWQIVERERFLILAQQQYTNTQRQLPQRGRILAIDGTILAVDEPVWNVYASLSTDPKERERFFSNKNEFITEVATILAIPIEEIDSKITQDFRHIKLADGVSNDKKTALSSVSREVFENPNFGFYFERDVKRTYPNNSLAAHILGFIGKNADGNYVGQYGVEGYYFSDIEGQAGYFSGERDSLGNVILNEEYDPLEARSGKSLKLTIRPSVQMKLEEVLEEGVKRTKSRSGSVIIMNPRTGAIIAMANYPTYNPNEYWLTQEPWIFRNLAVSDTYEYGSIHKPISVAIALESGISEDYTCDDKTGYLDLYEVTGYDDLKNDKVHTWNRRAAGKQNLMKMLANSNNPCIAKLALETGFENYYQKMRQFGIGSSINIGLQEEGTSYLRPYERWTRLDLITASFGQGISATPLQVISALSTIANDGKRMQPYIVDSIIDGDNITYTNPQVVSEPLSKDTANKVAKIMADSVENGGMSEYQALRIAEYEVAAKTGTSQIVREGIEGYQEGKIDASVVGFAPVSDPKFIMLLKLSEPQTGRFAAYNALPLWNDIFLEIVNDLEIPKRN